MVKCLALLLLLCTLASPALATDILTPLCSFGGSETDLAMTALALPDGLIMVGSTLSNDGVVPVRDNVSTNYCDALAIRVDAQGNFQSVLVVDERQLLYEQFTGVARIPDGRLALCYSLLGLDQETQQHLNTTRILIADDSLTLQGEITLPVNAQRIFPLSDGFMCLDTQAEPSQDGYDRRLSTLTHVTWDGSILWQADYPDLLPMRIWDIAEDAGQYWLVGDWRDAQPYSGAVVLLDDTGAIQAKTILPAKAYGGLQAGTPDGEGGLVAVGTQSNIMTGDGLAFYGHAVRFGPAGEILWNIEQARTGQAVEYASILKTDKGFLTVGLADIGGMQAGGINTDGKTGWLWLLDQDGNTLLEMPAGRGYATHFLIGDTDGGLYMVDSGDENGSHDMTITKVALP